MEKIIFKISTAALWNTVKKMPITCILTTLLVCMFYGCNQQYSVWKQDGKTGKWGYISYNGNQTVPYKYDSVKYLSNRTLSAVSLNGKWAVINHDKGEETTSHKYDYVGSFERGVDNHRSLKVNIGGKLVDKNEIEGGKWGLIDETGKEFVSCVYDDVGSYRFGNIVIKVGEKWGLIEIETGKEVVPCIYDNVSQGDNNTINVYLGEKRGKMDKDGEHILTRYIGEKKEGNDTYIVSFTLETAGDKRTIKYFSFKADIDLGAGEGAIRRTQTHSVEAPQENEVPANGKFISTVFEVTIKSNSAECTMKNDGIKYTCTAYPEK